MCYTRIKKMRFKQGHRTCSLVTSLAARLFGIWTLLSGILRFACAINIHNKILYHLTFFSFFLAFGHFVTELYPYETAELSLGVLAPLTVSSMSIILMSVGYFFLGHNVVPVKEGENRKTKIT
ncbi:probable ergosterol biosynthetic protein 28 isoform X2 [Pomacea canaliculata]|uniref:probable ergosterol biosynthetic protein 28 isoform X2 n=1 Tax=Pomacea canaliculata TaxID=400727 RepID=UPI000D737DEC|nr:probable ergosterol biosynthetic protein 28 isoform X2 [Pomacea canaliculata]